MAYSQFKVHVVEESTHVGQVEPETEDPLPEMKHALHPRFYYSWPCPLCNTMHMEEELANKDRHRSCQCRLCHRTFMTREDWLQHYDGCLRHV